MTEPVENKSPQPTPHHTGAEKSGHGVLIAIIAVIVVIAIVVTGVVPRLRAKTALKKETDTLAVPEVGVIQPKRGSTAQEIILPGNIQAFIDAPIYARTNGYLKIWYFDIGAHVRKGQLLAEIETPEVDQQLLQARAELETAQANLNIAKITATRWQDLVSNGSVSQQETDQAVNNLSAVKAAAESSAANVRRLEQLQSFEKIYAPFDGIITARNTDIGALIDAGATTQPRELFH